MTKTGSNLFKKSGGIDRRGKSTRIMKGTSKLGTSRR